MPDIFAEKKYLRATAGCVVMFDYSIGFHVTYQAECIVSFLAICISVVLVAQMYWSKRRAAAAGKPGLRRLRSPFVIQPLYEPILWLGCLVFVVRTVLLIVPGPYPAPPSWFSGAVETVGQSVPDAGALQHVEASRWVLNSALYFLYWFSFSLISEGVSLFFCFSSPSAKAVAASLKWALLLAALLATLTTVAFSHEQLDWPPAVHQSLDALFLVLPCCLHLFVLLRPADGAASAGRTRWAPLLFALFNLTWRLLSAAAIQAGVYQTIVGSVLKAIRALGLPLAVYGCLAVDTQHWHAVLRSVMANRQVVAVYGGNAPARSGSLEKIAEQQPLLEQDASPLTAAEAPPNTPPRAVAAPAHAKSPSQVFAANLLEKVDACNAASPLHRARVSSAGGGDGTMPPPLMRTSSAGNVLRPGSRQRRASTRRRRAGTASYSLVFLEPEAAPPSPPAVGGAAGFAMQLEHGSAAAMSYGTSSAAAPLLADPMTRQQRSASGDSAQWESLRPPAVVTAAGSSSPALRSHAAISPPARAGARAAPARSGIISPHELQVSREELGRGATSVVYKGRWQSRSVAVKRIIPDSLDAHTLAQFHEETMLLAALQHKRITRFYGMCVRPPGVELVFRLAAGGSLWDSLAAPGAAGMSRKRRLLLSLDAAEAVSHLHSLQPAPIVHRDIKSPNFLVQEGGRLMLGDFGQAAPLPRSGAFPPPQDSQALGTHGWAAPELLRGESYGAAVDVYALGIVLWEVWTGQRPFKDVPAEAMLFRVAVEGLRPPMPPSMPKALCVLLRNCWSSNPAARPTAKHVEQGLHSLLQQLSPPLCKPAVGHPQAPLAEGGAAGGAAAPAQGTLSMDSQ